MKRNNPNQRYLMSNHVNGGIALFGTLSKAEVVNGVSGLCKK